MSFFLLGLSFPFSLYRSMNVRILQKWKSSPKVYPFSLSDYNFFDLLFWLWLYYHLVLSNPDNNQCLFVWFNVIVIPMFSIPYKRDFQVTITLGMTDYYMHMGSFGSSNTTLWGELWGEFNLYSMHLSLCSLKNRWADLHHFTMQTAIFHMLAGLQLSWLRNRLLRYVHSYTGLFLIGLVCDTITKQIDKLV